MGLGFRVQYELESKRLKGGYVGNDIGNYMGIYGDI